MKAVELILLINLITASQHPFEFDNVKSPVEITSKNASYSIKEKKAYFSGDVKIVQDDLIISCEKGVVHFNKEGKIEKIILTGSVKIVRGDLAIIAKSAEFVRNKNIIIVKGSPRVWKGKDFIEGEVIEYDLNSDKITIKKASILIQQKK